jgi:16S rRNA (cytosine1402-N4)-methyltransferase
MHINNEIEEMINGFKSAACLLKQNGKLIIISFHSIEDRIAKNFLRSEEAKNLNLKKQGKPIKPTINEIKSNPRSRSAIMRIAIKNV